MTASHVIALLALALVLPLVTTIASWIAIAQMRRQLALYDHLLASREGAIRATRFRIDKRPDVNGFNLVMDVGVADRGQISVRYPIYDDEIEALVSQLRTKPRYEN